jgi:hypothetical protein
MNSHNSFKPNPLGFGLISVDGSRDAGFRQGRDILVVVGAMEVAMIEARVGAFAQFARTKQIQKHRDFHRSCKRFYAAPG